MTSTTLPKVAVVARVGPGLGASLARRFAREGVRVAVIARSQKYVETLAAEINARQKASLALGVTCDLLNENQIGNAFSLVRNQLGPVDLLVNNASGGGGPRGRGILEADPAIFEQAWRVGVYSAFISAREAVRDMVESGRGGTIIFTGATSSVRGSSVAFSSAKFASRGLADSLARELWPKGIHVAHAVIDGIIREVGEPDDESEPSMHPDAIAESYWQLVRQEKSSWTFELDLRAHREKFFE